VYVITTGKVAGMGLRRKAVYLMKGRYLVLIVTITVIVFIIKVVVIIIVIVIIIILRSRRRNNDNSNAINTQSLLNSQNLYQQ